MAAEKRDVYIRFPEELLAEIDRLAGPRKRSVFLAALVERRIAEVKSKGDEWKPSGGDSAE